MTVVSLSSCSQILALLTNMRHCSDPSMMLLNNTNGLLFRTFCSLRADQWYNFALLVIRHASVENLMYKVRIFHRVLFLQRMCIIKHSADYYPNICVMLYYNAWLPVTHSPLTLIRSSLAAAAVQ